MSPVAMTAARSVLPTPVEKAPSAPYVQVWLSAPMTRSPGADQPLFGKQHVPDARLAHFKIVFYPLLFREFAHDLGLLGGGYVLVGDKVIRDKGYLFGIEDMFRTDFPENFNGDRRRNIMGKGKVNLCLNQIARRDFFNPAWSARIFSVIVIGINQFTCII